MQITITVRSTDLSVVDEIEKMQIEGVTVRRRKIIKEIFPEPIDFILGFVSAISAQLIARYIYDKLKDKKEEVKELSINGQSVEINAEKIEQLILVSVKKEEDEKR
jgi:hypothetical protein